MAKKTHTTTTTTTKTTTMDTNDDSPNQQLEMNDSNSQHNFEDAAAVSRSQEMLQRLKKLSTPLQLLEQKILTTNKHLETLTTSTPAHKDKTFWSALRYKCLGFVEEGTRLLLEVDSIESCGDTAIRAERKAVVKKIEQLIAEGEQLVAKVSVLSSKAEQAAAAAAPKALQTDIADATADNDEETVMESGNSTDDMDSSDDDDKPAANTVCNGSTLSDNDDDDDDDDDDDSDDSNDNMDTEQIPSKPVHQKQQQVKQQQQARSPQKHSHVQPASASAPAAATTTTTNTSSTSPARTSSHGNALPPTLPMRLFDRGSYYEVIAQLPRGTRPHHVSIEPKSFHPDEHSTTAAHQALLIKGVHGASFLSKLRLPPNVDVDEARAHVEDELLHILIPKAIQRRAFARSSPWGLHSDPFADLMLPQFGW